MAEGRPVDEPGLLVFWEGVLGDVLDCTGRFPKSARFSLASRIDERSLDVLECLAEARFAAVPRRREVLATADLHLAVLRVLLRVSYDRRLLDPKALERLSRDMDEAGRMLGGWRRALGAREP
ncbi:MAG TPA: four helix bundle protein [Myxococcota bacterium]|nr:four helix bundle protein [Myxococcota bacterium]